MTRSKKVLVGAASGFVLLALISGPREEKKESPEEFRQRVIAEAEQAQRTANAMAADRNRAAEARKKETEAWRKAEDRLQARTEKSRARTEYNKVAWVYDIGPGWVMRAQAFGETLHVTVSSEWSRGWSVASCAVQRKFVWSFYTQWKERNPSAHTVKLLNPGGKEIGRYSELWGYHCGG